MSTVICHGGTQMETENPFLFNYIKWLDNFLKFKNQMKIV